MKMNKKKQSSGFTLVEALFAAMLLGLVIAALAAASGSFTMANGYGVDLSTAEFLIEEMREYTATLPVVDPEDGDSVFGIETGESHINVYDDHTDDIGAYDDIDDFNGMTIPTPIDVNGEPMNDFGEFSQKITVKNIASADFGGPERSAHSTDFVRVTVTVIKSGQPISSTSWIRSRLN